ncbi:LysR family transcriptional regulator [Salinimonas lutimaris]|uniref:LysR family transcriptional regulator n=1 Tax=Salinimonas lutimaris TaxID=914153 RepID=UPI0010BFBE46|nr:LysR family transcriptional regulator [Salinimonas lutimaris]
MLSLEQLHMFVLSAELGSFSACARKMGKVQSAVSHGVSSLEIDLGVTLFDRTTRSPTLTPAGHRLLAEAQAVLSQSGQIEKIARSINLQEESSLLVAVDDGLMHPLMIDVIKELGERFAHLQLDLQMMPSTDIGYAAISGELDMGVMFSELEVIRQADISYIGQVECIPICHPDFALAAQTVSSTSQLVAHRQIAIRGRMQEESLQLISLTPRVWWCSSHAQALALVEQQAGWAYVPAFLATSLIAQGRLTKISVAFDHKTWTVPVDVVFPKGRLRGPAFSWLFEKIRGVFSGPPLA